jgi:hypothetical protein
MGIATGFSIRKSMHFPFIGASFAQMNMIMGVHGERSLMICAISSPLIPGIKLSVTTKSCSVASNVAKASSAVGSA